VLRRSNPLQQRLLGVADRADDGDVQVVDRAQQSGDRRGIAAADILGSQQAPGDHIAHQIDGFVAFVRLDAVDGADDAAVSARGRLPGVVIGDVLAGAQQRAIGIEEVPDFPPRDGDCIRGQALLDGRVDVIDSLVLGKAQVADVQHHVKAEGEMGQGETIGSNAAIGTGGGGAGRVTTAMTAMVDEEDAVQGDDGALGEGGEAAQAGAAGGAVGDLGMIDAFGDGWIGLGDVHGVFRGAHRGLYTP
jgi:hypothetical protein